MSNDYYNHQSGLVSGTLARAEAVNSRFDAVEDGFDKLPAPIAGAPTTKGFSEAFTVVDASDSSHPVAARQIRDGSLIYVVDTGTANAVEVSMAIAPTAYTTGMELRVNVSAGNTGPATIDVNGLGLKNIKRISGDDLSSGDLVAGRISTLRYDGTNFVLLDGMYAIHDHDERYPLQAEFDAHNHNADYLGIDDAAADSLKLGTYAASAYARLDTSVSFTAITGTCLATSTDMTNGTAGQVVTADKLLERTGTTARVGLLELATPEETTTGTDTARACHPAGVKAAVDTTYTLTTLSTRMTTGTWTITGAVPLRPMLLAVKSLGNDEYASFAYVVTSGAETGSVASGTSYRFYLITGTSSLGGTGNSATIIPTSSTVVIEVLAATRIIAGAYQWGA